MSKVSLFAVVSPSQVNTKLAVLDDKVVVHLPNYMPLHEQAIDPKDSSKSVFNVLVDQDQLDYVDSNGSGYRQPHLWVGPKGQRPRPQDLVTVEILPVGAAAPALEALPKEVQLAVVILTQEPAALAKIEGLTADGLTKFATEALAAYTAAQKA